MTVSPKIETPEPLSVRIPIGVSHEKKTTLFCSRQTTFARPQLFSGTFGPTGESRQEDSCERLSEI